MSDSAETSPPELAAIMFTDVVGYAAIMGADEREGGVLPKKKWLATEFSYGFVMNSPSRVQVTELPLIPRRNSARCEVIIRCAERKLDDHKAGKQTDV